MKKIIILIVFTFGSFTIHAQDILTLKSGSEIKGVITEITQDQIKFKKTPEGPIYSLNKSDVFMIVYENGRKETFQLQNTPDNTTVPTTNPKPVEEDEKLDPSKHYGGPRIGMTYLSPGTTMVNAADLFNRASINPLISQFGWQFETRFFKLENGGAGLIEIIPLIGGIEQGIFLPSITGIIGYRNAAGHEIGVGPSLSLSGFGLVFAAGTSFKSGKVTFPVNIAFSPSIGKSIAAIPGYTTYNYNPSTGQYDLPVIHPEIPAYISRSGFRLSLFVGFNSRKN